MVTQCCNVQMANMKEDMSGNSALHKATTFTYTTQLVPCSIMAAQDKRRKATSQRLLGAVSSAGHISDTESNFN